MQLKSCLEQHENKFIFLLFLLIISLRCFPYLNTPPIWDAAAVFSAPIFIFEGGSYSELLKMPGYILGGPNIHSLSMYTIFVYIVMVVFSGNPDQYIPFLHLLSVFSATIIGYVFFILSKQLVVTRVALIATIVLILFPIFLVQASYIYMEIYGALFVILCMHYYVKKNYFRATLFAFLSLTIKALGLFSVTSIIFLLLIDLLKSREKRIFLYIILNIFFSVFYVIFQRFLFQDISEGYEITFLGHISQIFNYLKQTPDLLVLILNVPVAAVLFLMKNTWFDSETKADRVILAAIVFSFMFIAFILSVYLTGQLFFPLTRYYLWVIPSLFILLLYVFSVAFKNRYALNECSLVAVMLFFILNNNGRFYPYHNQKITSFSVTERSFEYFDFYLNQKSAVDFIDKFLITTDIPVLAARGEYYFMRSPLTGYMKNRVSNITMAATLPEKITLPDKLIIVDADSNEFHGQSAINSILIAAQNSDQYTVEDLFKSKSGPYEAGVYLVSKVK